MKKIAFLLSVLSCVLCSCSHKQVSTETERAAWHQDTLVKAYETVGRRSSTWDEPATNALVEYTRARTGNGDADTLTELAGDSAQEAVHAGCDDPLIRYLYCRFAPERSSKPVSFWQDEFRKTAQAMEASGYAPILKFYANQRAAAMLWQNYDKALWHQVVEFRRTAMADLSIALQDKSLPLEEIADACDTLIATLSQNDKEMTDAWTQIQEPLFKNWPDTSTAYFVKGRFYDRFGWQARGSGYADKVTKEGWAGFRKNLAVADAAFRKAWSLNPKDARIPTQMIEMAVSLEKNRTEMELWFQRAMQVDTNNYR